MTRLGSFSLAIAAASCAIVCTAPVAAQSSGATTSRSMSSAAAGQQPRQRVGIASVRGYPTAYVVRERPKDLRTPRQQCIDDEIAKAGGRPSSLALASIDLKCSQR
jgi:hypothetical protein